MKTVKRINQLDIKVGHIVHFHGARFEIVARAEYRDRETGELVVAATGKWLDGEAIRHYFGPDKDWNFQGNKSVIRQIEVEESDEEWEAYQALVWNRSLREREQYVPIPHPGDE
jgi:hypothetical protein